MRNDDYRTEIVLTYLFKNFDKGVELYRFSVFWLIDKKNRPEAAF